MLLPKHNFHFPPASLDLVLSRSCVREPDTWPLSREGLMEPGIRNEVKCGSHSLLLLGQYRFPEVCIRLSQHPAPPPNSRGQPCSIWERAVGLGIFRSQGAHSHLSQQQKFPQQPIHARHCAERCRNRLNQADLVPLRNHPVWVIPLGLLTS